MKMSVLRSLLLLPSAILVLVFAAFTASAQSFVYTNNSNPNAPNTVNAFSIGAGGALTPVAGAPYLTGGTGSHGGLFAARPITTSAAGRLLFIANGGSKDISVFRITPCTGALELVPGSPFPLVASPAPSLSISLAVTPDGRYLVAAPSTTGSVFVFAVADDGSLTPVPGASAPVPGNSAGIGLSPDGRFLAVPILGLQVVAVFELSESGILSAVPGSPFAIQAPGNCASADFTCAGDRVYIGNAREQSTVHGFGVAANGALTVLPGSPYIPGVGLNSNVTLVSPDDQFIFVSNQFSASITSFRIESNGSLSLIPGSPFSTGVNSVPTTMAADVDGSFLFTASGFGSIVAHEIDSDGSLQLVPGSPFSTGQPDTGGNLSIAVYPPKACSIGPPIDMTCPADVTVPSSTIQGAGAGAVVSFSSPVATGGCSTPEVTCSPASGSFFPIGSTTVTCIAADNCSRSSCCSFLVTVTSPFGSLESICVLDDASGDTFQQVVDRSSPLYGYWTYRVVATGQTITGLANVLSYAPGRSLVSSDRDYSAENRYFAMTASVSFGSSTATVRVIRSDGTQRFTLRDRSLRDDPPCQ